METTVIDPPDARIYVLRDTTIVRIRPLVATDEQALKLMLLRTSQESRYRRFLTPTPRISDALVRSLLERGSGSGSFVATTLDDTIIGIAHHAPVTEGDSEVALLIEDAWQGHGLGGLLLNRVIEQLSALGARTISGTILRDHQPSMRLLDGRFGAVTLGLEGRRARVRASIVHLGAAAARGSA